MRWRKLAASGQNVHGEADLVESLLRESGGTSYSTPAVAPAGWRSSWPAGVSRWWVSTPTHPCWQRPGPKRPDLSWVEADLADLGSAVPGPFDLALLAGNVMIFLEPGTEARTLAALAARLAPGGLLVAGFSVRADRLTLDRYDQLVGDVGLEPVSRWATSGGEPFEGGDYAVSVHRLIRSSAT